MGTRIVIKINETEIASIQESKIKTSHKLIQEIQSKWNNNSIKNLKNQNLSINIYKLVSDNI